MEHLLDQLNGAIDGIASCLADPIHDEWFQTAADEVTQGGSTNLSGVGPVHAADFCGRVTAMWLRIRRW